MSRLNIGGPSIQAQILAEGLDSEKFSSTTLAGQISTHEGDMTYLFDSSKVKPVILKDLQREIDPFKDLKAFFKTIRIINQIKPDIVHSHMAKAGFVGRLGALLVNFFSGSKIKTVHTFHGHVFRGYFSRLVSKIYILIERVMARFTDSIIAISATQKKELVEEFKIAPSDKIRIIELGFNLLPFLNSEHSKGAFRRKLDLDDNTLVIGIVGRLVPIKNHRMFIEAGSKLIENRPGLNLLLAVIGDGELRGELEAQVKSHNLNGRVKFCGWEKDVATVYPDLDILALTSLNEGTPVSIIEAMASSVPVIATDAGGVIDLLGRPQKINSANGFEVRERGVLCRTNDPIGFANGLKWLADNRELAHRTFVKKAKTFVSEQYSHSRLIRDMERLYADLVC
jgi:glycosyltransferase involved in cell wall biosynthesis